MSGNVISSFKINHKASIIKYYGNSGKGDAKANEMEAKAKFIMTFNKNVKAE